MLKQVDNKASELFPASGNKSDRFRAFFYFCQYLDSETHKQSGIDGGYNIDQLCAILQYYLGKAQGESKTAAQNCFYAIYNEDLAKYDRNSIELRQIYKTMGTTTSGPFSWIASLCVYLRSKEISFKTLYEDAKNNKKYSDKSQRQDNINGLQYDFQNLKEEADSVIAGAMYFGVLNAQALNINQVIMTQFAQGTEAQAISAGKRFYEFVLKNEELLERKASSEVNQLLKKYNKGQDESLEIPRELESKKAHNRIVFGAPGTGKSFLLNEEREYEFKERYERVTFHPDYSYAHFVGTYKPVMVENEGTGKKEIEYNFVAGPFLRTYLKAKMSSEPILLLIEEINRANVAAVFGDIFQLLDRDENGVSEYPVAASEDVRQWLRDHDIIEETLSLPANMYIWATMNSADQGVYPMDTAFKRRWGFEYLSLDAGKEELLKDEKLKANGAGENWNEFRVSINEFLTNQLNVNEDKCLGPFFLKKEEIAKWGTDKFKEIFKSKILMYLFEDAAKHKRTSLFAGGLNTFSSVCDAYDKNGNVFSNSKLDELIKVKLNEETEETGEKENANKS